MALNIKHPDLPFTVIGSRIRLPNGQERPLAGESLALVQVHLLNELLTEMRKANEVPPPPEPPAITTTRKA